MNPKFRRIIVWVLLISLILSLVPAVVLTAFAEDCVDNNHDFSDWAPAEDGTEERHCKNTGCTVMETREHVLAPVASENDTEHFRQCENCSYRETKNHSFAIGNPALYDNDRHTLVCQDCSREKTEAHDYTYTPNADGDTHTIRCQKCLYQETGDHDFTEAEPVKVDGAKHSLACKDCLYEREIPHTYDRKVIKSDYEESKDAYYLSCVCGAASNEDTFPVHTVIFDPGFTGADSKAVVVEADNDVDEPEGITKTREGYRFEGWYNGETKFEPGHPVSKSFTVTAKWAKLYSITVDSSIANGTVTVSTAKAAEGDTVAITVSPNSGYELDELTCTADDGSSVTVADTETGKEFVMPGKTVTITAAFQISDFALIATPAGDLFVGSTTQLSTDTGIVPTWVSNAPGVATVSSTGVVTGVSVGEATITATVGDKEAKAPITVKVVAVNLSVGDKIISGKTGAELPTGSNRQSVILSLREGSFAEALTKADILVTNLPADVDYDLVRTSASTVQIAFKGTPTQASSAGIAVTVKKTALVNPPASAGDYTVANENTRWDIVQSCTITLDNGGSTSADTAKGEVVISPAVVAPGETVTVSITPKAPFKLKSVEYTAGDTTEKINAINGRYTFRMPESATEATITVRYEMPHTSKTGECSSKIRSFSLPDHEKLKNAILNDSTSVSFEGTVTGEQLTALTDGGDYAFVLSVEPASSTSDKKKLDTATNISAIKGPVYTGDNRYMDITLWFEIYNARGEQVGSAIKITDTGTNYVSLAFNALRSPATRLYYVHNGRSAAYYSQESGSTNGNVKYSKLHLFSTYELVYTTISDNPKTADPFHLPIWAAVFVLSGLALPVAIFGGKKYLL